MSNTVKATGPAKQTAQIAEATKAPAVIEWQGVKYTIPTDADEVGVELYEAVNDLQILAALIGPDQFQKWRATNPRIKDLKAFGDMVAEASGFASMGN